MMLLRGSQMVVVIGRSTICRTGLGSVDGDCVARGSCRNSAQRLLSGVGKG